MIMYKMRMVKKANNSQPLDISPLKLGHFKRKPITVVEHNVSTFFKLIVIFTEKKADKNPS